MTLAAKILLLSGICDNNSEAMEMLEDKFYSGKALVKLAQMIEAQGGNADIVDDLSLLPQAAEVIDVRADDEGYISEIRTSEVGMAACMLGAGRMKKEDTIDPSVGIVLKKRLGDFVKKGEVLAEFHVNDKKNLEDAEKRFKAAYSVSEQQPDELPLIYTIIDE